MLKTVLIAIAASAATASTMLVFVGRTVHSSPFQMDIPYGSAVRTTIDPANVWSWHHTFTNGSGTADVLVDVDGNNVMDTEHPWLRVMVTDISFSNPSVGSPGFAWIRDSVGRRYVVGHGGGISSSTVDHASLTSPIVLPVGSSLSVELQGGSGSEVHLVGRVVNL